MAECPHFGGWKQGTGGYPDIPTCRLLDGALCEDEKDREHQKIPRKFRACYRYHSARAEALAAEVEGLTARAAEAIDLLQRQQHQSVHVIRCEFVRRALSVLKGENASGADCEWPICTSALTKDIGGSRSCDIGGPHWVEAKTCRSCHVWPMEAALRAVKDALEHNFPEDCAGGYGCAVINLRDQVQRIVNAALAAMEVKGG